MKRFADPRSGHYRMNGNGRTAYESFVPTPLQKVVVNIDDKMLAAADKALEHLSDKDKEGRDFTAEIALSSVRLAWNIPPLMLETITPDAEKMELDKSGFTEALAYGIDSLDRMPLSGRLLKDLHWIALPGDHNIKAYPGEMRTSPIWIGAEEDSLTTAPFIPPSPSDMLTAFYDLEQYINTEDNLHPLIKAALIHYQFEVINPFVDGNGRIGRLLVLLYLIDRGILHGANVNLSGALHSQQFQYYAGIASVEISGTYEKWIHYFLDTLMTA